jgi:hypothetical protein
MPIETEFSQFIEFINSLGIHRTYIIYKITCMQLQNHFSLIWYKAFTFKLLMNSMLREHPILSVQYAMIWHPCAQWRSGDPSGIPLARGASTVTLIFLKSQVIKQKNEIKKYVLIKFQLGLMFYYQHRIIIKT